MKTIKTREEILDLLIEVEINPKEILKYNIENDYISKQLNSMLEMFLLDEDFNRKDFNDCLITLTRTVTNKFN